MPKPILLQADDLSLSEGNLATWQDKHGNAVQIKRSPENHFVMIGDQPVLYGEAFGQRWWRLAKIPQEVMGDCIDLIKNLAGAKPQNRLEILEINNQPATDCKLAQVFLQNGFVQEDRKLVFDMD